MIFEFIFDVVKLLLILVSLYIAIYVYVRHKQPTWSIHLQKRWLTILLILVLAMIAAKIFEDVLDDESVKVDNDVILFVHHNIPESFTNFFEIVTLTGSSTLMTPLTTILVVILLLAKRRFDALFLAVSVLGASSLIYLIKMAVGRVRPALWETEIYWGSSFPSGHTLIVAAFGTACAISITRVWPRARIYAIIATLTWIFLVGLSRLFLGVHWPTDVLAAACIGIVLPMGLRVAIDIFYPASVAENKPQET